MNTWILEHSDAVLGTTFLLVSLVLAFWGGLKKISITIPTGKATKSFKKGVSTSHSFDIDALISSSNQASIHRVSYIEVGQKYRMKADVPDEEGGGFRRFEMLTAVASKKYLDGIEIRFNTEENEEKVRFAISDHSRFQRNILAMDQNVVSGSGAVVRNDTLLYIVGVLQGPRGVKTDKEFKIRFRKSENEYFTLSGRPLEYLPSDYE